MFEAPIDDDDLARFAEACARLTIRLADRAAVLWRAGYDEDGWALFETRCLDALAPVDERGRARRERFGLDFERTRRALADPGAPSTARRSEVAPTVAFSSPEGAGTLASPEGPAPTTTAERPRLAVMEAMTTLASNLEPSAPSSGAGPKR